VGEVVWVDRATLSQAGQRAKELEQMLRIYFLQQWFNLADPAVEEALYDSATCGSLQGLTWDRSQRRTRPRCASSVICWKRTIWEKRFWGQ
jgi:hypothetical protein